MRVFDVTDIVAGDFAQRPHDRAVEVDAAYAVANLVRHQIVAVGQEGFLIDGQSQVIAPALPEQVAYPAPG